MVLYGYPHGRRTERAGLLARDLPPPTPPIASAFGDTDGEIFSRKYFRPKKYSAEENFGQICFWPKNFSAETNLFDFFLAEKSSEKLFSRKQSRLKGILNTFGRKIVRPKTTAEKKLADNP